MLPNTNDFDNLEIEMQPSKNYKMQMKNKHINGYLDELEAMKQVIYKILNTNRYQYLIYSWNYGIELDGLLGEPVNYVCAELQRRITEALIQDDRIISVDSFNFELVEKNVINASFKVHTIYGDVDEEKAVNY